MLPSLDKDVVTLANIDLNNNISNYDSNIDKNEDEELEVSLNTDSEYRF